MKSFTLFAIALLLVCFLCLLVAVAEDSKPPSPLTTDEQDQLMILLMQAQSARIVMLEKLASKSAGSEDVNLADQASQAYTTLLRSLIKKHSAGDTCQWNFISKAWVCPSTPAPAPAAPAPAPPAEPDKR